MWVSHDIFQYMSTNQMQTSNGVTNIASILIGLALVFGIGGVVYWQTSSDDVQLPPGTDTGVTDTGTVLMGETEDEDDDGEKATTGGSTSGTPASGGTGITAAVVAQHNSRTSCWTSINGSVYDLTSWIPKHPGGEQAILQLCGTDGSAKFNRQHGGDSAKESVLAGFRVGVLAR